MKTRLLIILCLILLVAAPIISFTVYDKFQRHEGARQDYDSMPCDVFLSSDFDRNSEFDYLYKQKLRDCIDEERSNYQRQYSHSFPEDPLGKLNEWCLSNNGKWNKDEVRCYFTSETQSKFAHIDQENREKPQIVGKFAKAVCDIMELPCPQHPEFIGSYSFFTDRMYVNQLDEGTQYTFYMDNSIADKLNYQICTPKDIPGRDNCEWQQVDLELDDIEYLVRMSHCIDGFYYDHDDLERKYPMQDGCMAPGMSP